MENNQTDLMDLINAGCIVGEREDELKRISEKLKKAKITRAWNIGAYSLGTVGITFSDLIINRAVVTNTNTTLCRFGILFGTIAVCELYRRTWNANKEVNSLEGEYIKTQTELNTAKIEESTIRESLRNKIEETKTR